MLNPGRKNGSVCQSLLQGMETGVQTPRLESKITAIAIPSGMKYPRAPNLALTSWRSSEDTCPKEDFRRVTR